MEREKRCLIQVEKNKAGLVCVCVLTDMYAVLCVCVDVVCVSVFLLSFHVLESRASMVPVNDAAKRGVFFFPA